MLRTLVHKLTEKIYLATTVVADGHPTGAATEEVPCFRRAFEKEPGEMIGGGAALRTRFRVAKVFPFCVGGGMFLLQLLVVS